MAAIPISGAEELAWELLRAAEAKASAIAQARAGQPPVIALADFATSEPPEGLIDDSAAVIELVLKHCLACNSMRQGDTRERQVIEEEIKGLRHNASKIFERLSEPTRGKIRDIYAECNRGYSNSTSIFGKMADLEEMLAWVRRGPNHRYDTALPEPYVPIGGCWSPAGTSNVEQLPSFPDELVNWASEEFRRAKPARSRREALDAIDPETRDAEERVSDDPSRVSESWVLRRTSVTQAAWKARIACAVRSELWS